mmetsp:Transcript_31820/g.79262  ORF Transcript_31820/g.79262 Transcript_31820/m.79262 type:complete len:288 (+) Transcript_31820:286-1149(+)
MASRVRKNHVRALILVLEHVLDCLENSAALSTVQGACVRFTCQCTLITTCAEPLMEHCFECKLQYRPDAFAKHEPRRDHEHVFIVRVGVTASPSQLNDCTHDARNRPVRCDVHANAKTDARRKEISNPLHRVRAVLNDRQCCPCDRKAACITHRRFGKRRATLLHQDGHVFPHVRYWRRELRGGYPVHVIIQLIRRDRDEDRRGGSNELGIILSTGRAAEEVAGLQVLQEVAGLCSTGLRKSASHDVRHHMPRRHESKHDLRQLADSRDRVEVRLAKSADGKDGDNA